MSRRHPIRFLPVALLLPVALGAQTPARRHVDVPTVAPAPPTWPRWTVS